ncbi:hypothetical protein ACNKHM_20170 [Shigella sonnei]
MREHHSQEARRLFSEAGLPTYRSSEGTITAFMHMVEYRRNQKQLRETPALPSNLTSNTAEAHPLLQHAICRRGYVARYPLKFSPSCKRMTEYSPLPGLPVIAPKRYILPNRLAIRWH